MGNHSKMFDVPHTCMYNHQRMYPECLTVLNTTKAERNTLQNNKDNQGLFAATLSFMNEVAVRHPAAS